MWTEAFLWIERKVEGERPKQMKLDKQPWSLTKFRIKFTKHFLWVVFSIFTGVTFVGYFSPIKELFSDLLLFNNGPWESFWIYFYALATYGNAGWLREQVCMYMCPYARFQSAMIDSDTLMISYDEPRGEPRGSRKRSIDPKEQGLGSCIDCTICVQVCPTGIDIRDGLQYECIGCAACIDACDDVMEQMGYEKGLIKYTTENTLMGKRTKLLRPRIVIYAIILLCVTFGTFYSINTRMPLAMDVIRDRNTLFRETNDGLIENVYILKIMNMEAVDHSYSLTVTGIEGLKLLMDVVDIEVASGAVIELPLRVQIDPDNLNKRSTVLFFSLNAIDTDELYVEEEARLIGPLPTR